MKKRLNFNLKHYFKNRWILLLLSLLVFAVISFVLVYFSKKISPTVSQNLATVPYEAYYKKKINTDFKSELIFNDIANEKPFTPMLLDLIKNAKTDIKLAMYSIDSEVLKDELFLAAKRGVKVDVVLSINKKNQHEVVFVNAPKNLNVRHVGSTDNNSRNLMHHKFVIFDHKLPSRTLVMGAFNWTQLQELFDPSFVIKTQDEDMVNVYLEEFERLNKGQTGKKKLATGNYRPWQADFEYNNGNMELWWSPGVSKNTIKQRLLDSIYSASSTIDVMIWQLSDQDVIKAFRKKASEGVKIKIIADDFNAWRDSSKIKDLLEISSSQSNLEVITDAARTIDFANEIKPYLNKKNSDFNSFLHHHVAIIDGNKVIAGTNNWSYSADFKNDESAFLTTIKELVDAYQASFDFHYAKLHSQSLQANLTDKKITINNLNEWLNLKLIFLAEDKKGVKNPRQCHQIIIKNSKLDWQISDECADSYLNLFVVDYDGDVKANKLLDATIKPALK